MRSIRTVRPRRTEAPAGADRCGPFDSLRSLRAGRAAPYAQARRLWAILAVATAGFLAAVPAAACPVCYGEAGGDVIDGAKLSVLFLGGLVYLVIGAGVGVVLALRRRVRKNLDSRRGLHLVPPPEASRS